MISACFILNPKGVALAVRQYKHDIPPNYVQAYADHGIFQTDNEQSYVAPVFELGGLIYARVVSHGVHYVAVAQGDSNVFAMTEYLNKLVKVFCSYFDKPTEAALQDNVTLVYELLDETLDYGVPADAESQAFMGKTTRRKYRRFSLYSCLYST